MDPVKIILFVIAFVALLLLGRMLSRMSEVHVAALPVPQPGGSANMALPGDDRERSPAVIGSEIAFPIQIPDVKQFEDGTFNRPHILNYYFARTDLLRGPEDPESLFDELTIEAQDPAHNLPTYYSYTVATPSGLRHALDREKLASLYLDRAPVIIVPRWDLALILQTAMDEIMRVYNVDRESAHP